MTPGAHLQTAVEILQSLDQASQPADLALRQWSRGHRFAGSHDRRKIAQRVYAVLRQRGHLSWRTQSSDMRMLVMASLIEEGATLSDVELLCDGGIHHLSPLSDDERACLSALAEGSEPLWARANIPPFLERSLRLAFDQDLEREIAALSERAPLDLRVNTAKYSREDAQQALTEAGLQSERCRFAPFGLRLVTGAAVDRTSLYAGGGVEIQDEGSQLASLIAVGELASKDNAIVVDYCAGAGGKTLAMTAALRPQARIYACDINANRLSQLEKRLARAGVRNVSIRPQEGLTQELSAAADLVLLDVPCTGSGTWRRSPENRWRLTPEALDRFRDIQARLLDRGARLVKKGGRLVYVTCSFFREENDEQIESFLARHPNFTPVPALKAWHAALGTVAPPESLLHTAAQTAGLPAIRLFPGRDGTDGFFICVLQG